MTFGYFQQSISNENLMIFLFSQGDTVNVASRMESTGIMGRMQITNETAKLLMNSEKERNFDIELRGQIMVKGKGDVLTYLIKTQYDNE